MLLETHLRAEHYRVTDIKKGDITMILTRINGKYSLEVRDLSRKRLIEGLTQIAVMLKEESNSSEDALFITDIVETKEVNQHPLHQ